VTKTIAVSNKVYEELKKLKESLGVGYSELLEILIKEYRERRIEKLINIIEKTKLTEEELRKVEEVVKRIRERRWW